MMIGTQDLWIGLVLAAFLFGAKKLPELAGSLGKSIKKFRKATTEPEPPPAAPVPASQRCGSCQTPLEAEWRHCPRCDAAVRPPTTLPPSA